MKKLAITLSTVLASSGLFTGAAHAAWSDLYFGGKIGYANLDDACYLDSPCDDESLGFGVYYGYDFNKIISAELGIDMLGEYEANFSNGYFSEGKLAAFTLAPKINLPINDKLDAFVKLGAAYMLYGEDKDLVPTGSLGIEYALTESFKARAEYQRYQDMSDEIVQDMDANFFAIGITYLFGGASSAAATAAAAKETAVEPRATEEVQSEPVVAEPILLVEEAKPEPKPEWVSKFSNQQFNQELFATGSSTLSPSGKQALDPLAEALLKFPDAQANIVGHTDSTGSEKVNQRISEQRAQAVADYLVSRGVKLEQLTVVGAGESQPVATNKTAEGRAKNRRVEVTIPSFEYQELQQPTQ
ncbi:TPA: OmpA family protein [Vibrio vulnificus]|uniref:OmpA family protein n=1 Tax=Vibrio sp. 05-20-BW147 TaxID=2575834 RepID=UPI001594581D|nr:OmpA family protein [Vibrio sp. 05-20-BW147]NVC61735.1 OmpA family protein [Vibrio sp. 05-20-BW147]HAS6346897.1 OmpA family protein [Vibrio vulnificus]